MISTSNYNSTKIEENLELYEDLDILQLLNLLDTQIGLENCDQIRPWFKRRQFEAKYFFSHKGRNNIVLVKYNEENFTWRPKWARQCRGIGFLKSKKDGRIYCIKVLLQRGMEMLTKHHFTHNITETENLSLTISKRYDPIQTENIKTLKQGGPINGYLSFKVDGSLLGITLYGRESTVYEEVCDLITTMTTDKFHLNLKLLAEELGLPFLPVLASQNSFFMGCDMYDYNLTAILCGYGKMDFESLRTFVLGVDPSDSFIIPKIKHILSKFLLSLHEFYLKFNTEGNSSIMTLCFESTCPNRTTAWFGSYSTGLDHSNALTVNYPYAILSFIGFTNGIGESLGKFIAHFQIEEEVHAIGWDQPMYWRVSHTDQINKLLLDLEKVIKGDLTHTEYLKLNPPSNKLPLACDFLDYEGFVFYREIDGVLDYSKIKTSVYYATHIIKKDNIKDILKYSKEAEGIFPNCLKVKEAEFTVRNRLLTYILKFDHELNSNLSMYVDMLPESALANYNKYEGLVQRLILLNNSNVSPILKDLSYKIALEYFSYLQETPETKSMLLKIMINYYNWVKSLSVPLEINEDTYLHYKNWKRNSEAVENLIYEIYKNK